MGLFALQVDWACVLVSNQRWVPGERHCISEVAWTPTVPPALVQALDEYLRRNIRTYSSMSRAVLSALGITPAVMHNDVSESSFTTSSTYLR